MVNMNLVYRDSCKTYASNIWVLLFATKNMKKYQGEEFYSAEVHSAELCTDFTD